MFHNLLFTLTLGSMLMGASPALASPQSGCAPLFVSSNMADVRIGEKTDWIPFFIQRNRVKDSFVLGRGSLGGTVYRIVFRDGTARSYKVYDSFLTLNSDLKKENFLKKSESELPFKIARYKRTMSPMTVEVDTVFGESVLRLSQAVGSAKNQDAIDKYNEAVVLLSRWAERNPNVKNVSLLGDNGDGMFQLKIQLVGLGGMIWVHPGNVIYSPGNNTLVLIDPA